MNPFRLPRHQVALPVVPFVPFQLPFPSSVLYQYFYVQEDSRMNGFQRFATFTPRPYAPANDAHRMWTSLQPMIEHLLHNRIYPVQAHGSHGFKFSISICLLLRSSQQQGIQEYRMYHSTHASSVTSPSLLAHQIRHQLSSLYHFFFEANYVVRSNAEFIQIEYVDVQYAFYPLQQSRSYIVTPKKLARKRCLVNPKNEEDSLCLQWCLYAYHHSHPPEEAIFELKMDPEEVEIRNAHLQEHNWNWKGIDLTRGATLSQVIQFESQNPSYCFSIIYWDPEEKEAKNASKTLYISPHWNENPPREHSLCLMMLSEETLKAGKRYHFTWVHNYHRLFSSFHAGYKKFVCLVEGLLFSTEEEWKEHSQICQKPDQESYTMLSFPKPADAHCEFKDVFKQLQCPYYIVADMESINVHIIAKAKCGMETCRHTHYYTQETIGNHQSEEHTFTCQYCGSILEQVEWNSRIDAPGEEPKTLFLSEQRSNSQAFYVVCTFDSSRNKMIYLNHAYDEEELFREDEHHSGRRFMKKLLQAARDCVEDVQERVRNTTTTEQEWEQEQQRASSSICCVCHRPLEQGEVYKNVLTQQVEGMAHSICRQKMMYGYRTSYTDDPSVGGLAQWSVPVFFHNLKNYDGHFIIQWLHDLGHGAEQVRVIAQNTEKFVSISLPYVKFLDSFAFMTSGLSTLVDVLRGVQPAIQQEIDKMETWWNANGERLSSDEKTSWQNRIQEWKAKRKTQEQTGMKQFKYLRQEFDRDLNRTVKLEDREEALSLCFSKGHLPYEYIDSIGKLSDPCLPPASAYSSRLMGTGGLSETEYAVEQRKWVLFQMTSLRDAHDLYLKLDILLLADVLENFRQTMFQEFHLDPTWNYTLPGYAWDCLLRMGYRDEQGMSHPIRLQLFDDTPLQSSMLLWIEKDIRGGMCNAPRHYAYAKNPYVPSLTPEQVLPQSTFVKETPVQEEESVYLMYVDANQLYSWAMTQKLPYDQFEWIAESEMSTKTAVQWSEFVMNIGDDADYGAILEVDLHYPLELHESHTDYPLAPENRMVETAELSPLTHHIIAHNQLNYTPSPKLCGTLEHKTHYKVYYRNLKQYLQLGMKLTAVHKVMRFRQVAWMKSFIMHNVEKRAVCQNEFQKDLYKLQNNAVFGKTMENVRKRCKYNLIMGQQPKDLEQFQKRVQSPFYKNSVLIAHNTSLLGISSQVSRLTFNKPITVGFVILDLSKTLMFEFHYNVVKKRYGNRVKLCMTDTDSLVERIRIEDLYQDLKDPSNPVSQWMDFSNYKAFNRPGCNILPLSHWEHYKSYYEAHGFPTHESWRIDPVSQSAFFFQSIPTITESKEWTIPPNVQLQGYQPQNNKVQGKFKDENAGCPLMEICALKPKCYAMKDVLDHSTLKAKGIPKKALQKDFDLERYKNCIRQTQFSAYQTQFHKLVSQQHAIYMIERQMVGLTGLNSKSFTCDNGIETLAFGDYRIPQQRQQSIWKS